MTGKIIKCEKCGGEEFHIADVEKNSAHQNIWFVCSGCGARYALGQGGKLSQVVPKYNAMIDVAFSVVTPFEYWEDIPASILVEGLRKRLEFLETNPSEAAEAFGFSDQYEIDKEGKPIL
jgi:transcription elongation factor Elf1